MENINIILRAKGIEYQEGSEKLKWFSGITYGWFDGESREGAMERDEPDMDWNTADLLIIYHIQFYNKLSVKEKNKFHNLLLEDEKIKEEIKQILLDFKQLSNDKNLSFDEFLSENRPLNTVIKEVLKI